LPQNSYRCFGGTYCLFLQDRKVGLNKAIGAFIDVRTSNPTMQSIFDEKKQKNMTNKEIKMTRDEMK
jgi:hypothetical protein